MSVEESSFSRVKRLVVRKGWSEMKESDKFFWAWIIGFNSAAIWILFLKSLGVPI